MRWRLSKLDWPYAVGELIIVTAGVLIALAIDQWNSERLDRVEEVAIIDRFIGDLQTDLGDISGGLELLSDKQDHLLRVVSGLDSSNERPADKTRFLEDVAGSAQYGWNQARARRTTFDEVLESGRFSLVRDTATRIKIADYYAFETGIYNRIDERETQYPYLSYRLVPRTGEFSVDTTLNDAQVERLFNRIFDSSLSDHVTAEMNFAHFVIDRFLAWRIRCSELINELEAYRSTIR